MELQALLNYFYVLDDMGKVVTLMGFEFHQCVYFRKVLQLVRLLRYFMKIERFYGKMPY